MPQAAASKDSLTSSYVTGDQVLNGNPAEVSTAVQVRTVLGSGGYPITFGVAPSMSRRNFWLGLVRA